jgi:ABC-type antimicrobial peptide transport system, ATPase component
MGPSGSLIGTLLNLLSLIDRPSGGIMKYGNKQIDFRNSNYNDILRANKIGIIYQQENLLPEFTALENVYLANLAIEKNKNISVMKSKQLLKKVGLSNRIYHYPAELSGGEKQRVSIARALINEPQVIQAEEPTGSQEIVTAKKVGEL